MIDSLGRYKILEQLGAGALGGVYRARDSRHGRTVAIRVLPEAIAADPERRARLLQDARAAAVLSHPNIATLYEVGEEDDKLFLVFDFVPGETLSSAIVGRPMNPRRAIELAAQIADGLADAHAAGVVHRDIRPDNIVVTPKGAAKILDVGLASCTAGGTKSRSSPYRSPEQAASEAIDERTDVYSLGAVLFEMLTGKPPRDAEGQEPRPTVSSVNRALGPQFNALVATAMAGSRGSRYQSAATLAAELRTVAAALDAGRQAIPMPVLTKRRSNAGVLLALALVVALTAAAWLFYAG